MFLLTWTVTVITSSKKKQGKKLVKEKALKITKYGRTEAQSWHYGSENNNNI